MHTDYSISYRAGDPFEKIGTSPERPETLMLKVIFKGAKVMYSEWDLQWHSFSRSLSKAVVVVCILEMINGNLEAARGTLLQCRAVKTSGMFFSEITHLERPHLVYEWPPHASIDG